MWRSRSPCSAQANRQYRQPVQMQTATGSHPHARIPTPTHPTRHRRTARAASALPIRQVMQEPPSRPISRPTARYHDRDRRYPAGLAVAPSRTGIRRQELHSNQQRSVSFMPLSRLPQRMPGKPEHVRPAPSCTGSSKLLFGIKKKTTLARASSSRNHPAMGDQQKWLAGVSANSPRQYLASTRCSKSANGSSPGGVQQGVNARRTPGYLRGSRIKIRGVLTAPQSPKCSSNQARLQLTGRPSRSPSS